MVSIPFLVDEHVSQSIVGLLQSRGHRVDHVRDLIREGAEDADVIFFAKQTQRVVLTKNKKDYVDAAHRALTAGYKDHRGWGLVVYYGEDSAARHLIADAIATVEHEFGQCYDRRPSTLMIFMELLGSQMRIHRTAADWHRLPNAR